MAELCRDKKMSHATDVSNGSHTQVPTDSVTEASDIQWETKQSGSAFYAPSELVECKSVRQRRALTHG